ncbi:MAG: AAA family ATPase [Candidatus Omnitrophica bacterium]|nr:AAA family ATPase [Candidatus Omnitrophota bacterium]
MAIRALEPEKLRAKIDISTLGFTTTEEIIPYEGIIGQERAAHALEFGLSITQDGYNIYVSGIPGSGRVAAVESTVKKIAEKLPIPDDWCYVHNFSHPDNPKCLRFPPGKAIIFKKDMQILIDDLQVDVPKAFESKFYEEQKNLIVRDFQNKKDELIREIEEDAKRAGFNLKSTTSGFMFIPAVEGKPLSEEDLEKLSDEAKKEIRDKQEILYEQLSEILRQIKQAEKTIKEKLEALERDTALATIKPKIEDLKDKYKDFSDVISYLDEVLNDTVENVEAFGDKKEMEILPGLKLPARENPLIKYDVNVLIDNSQIKGAPVIKESNPTYYNLTGRTEYRPSLGAMFTDFTMIKPGSFHRANGGYLILNTLDLLRNYFAWDAVKSTIENKEIRIEDINEQFRIISTPSLKPQPVPARVKVILIGNPLLHLLLYTYEESFNKLFKVKVDFSTIMEKDNKGINEYVSVISRIVRENSLKHLDKTAVAKIIEFGSRIIEDQKKISTHFIEISDLIKEANFWAEKDNGSSLISAKHITKAIEEKIYRSNLIEKRIEELIHDNTIMVDVDGNTTGQINGLSVMSIGDYMFGKPSRITATTYIGRGGVINIEREVKLSGSIHNKGFLILKGLLGEKFGHKYPLIFNSTICFEQTYQEIEGDSASSTEYYALISSLSGIPIKQGIAVTGSINQKGEIQPIGGVNEKIEGFYSVCKLKGLTGQQGVIIPESNVKHLMLKEEVIESVRENKFHIWAVKTVNEGIEILTGVPAGEKGKDGSYPERTVNYAVGKKLIELARKYHNMEEITKPPKTKSKKKK